MYFGGVHAVAPGPPAEAAGDGVAAARRDGCRCQTSEGDAAVR